MLATAGWPRIDASLRDVDAEREFERVRAIVTAIREVRAQHQVLPKRRITLHASAPLIESLRAAGGLAYIENLAGLERITTDAPAPGTTKVVATYDAQELGLSNLADAVDASAEQDRLARELAEKIKSAETMSKRLENPGYIAKAPAKLVEESKQQLATLQAEITAIRERLA
jgi:valyl-tRNA synthetase